MVLSPRSFSLPSPVKRTAGIAANFLCDNSTYFLGFDNKGNSERAQKCFKACKALHETLLSEANSAPALAVLQFFRNWEPEEAMAHPALQNELENITAGANLIFQFNGEFVHDDPAIREAWQKHYSAGSSSGPKAVCLVTGETTTIEAVHPAVKGVQGAQSSGAALVSFNAPAFCSYGKEQNLNAPTGKYASFAYTTALNHLLADKDHVFRFGDLTIVCWAKGGEPAYQDALGIFAFGAQGSHSDSELPNILEHPLKGQTIQFNETLLDMDRPFYILGLSPNAARLSVRFFLQNSFSGFMKNVQAHYRRLEIIKPSFDRFQTLPLWKLLSETVNQNAKDKSPSPNMAGMVLRSVLMDEPYPFTLLNSTLLRIRAEQEITRGRAAIIKAFYLKRPHPDIEEVLTVSLKTDSTNPYYTLGRLFSVLESIQTSATPGLNATIKDRYFNSASTTPGRIFPVLLNLSQKHLRKLDVGLRVFYEKKLSLLMNVFGESFPPQLNLPQQGAFQLGYYHETQARYQKKENAENE